MHICNESCPFGQLAVLRGKLFNVGHYTYIVQPMHIGTIDMYHFILPSQTLTLAGGHKVSTKQNLLASFFWHTFRLIGMKIDVELKHFKLNILRLRLSQID